jgi:hypothetical protein
MTSSGLEPANWKLQATALLRAPFSIHIALKIKVLMISVAIIKALDYKLYSFYLL